ncbi:MAG: hypothetical protein RLZZ453_782 [Chlamydiota bacterium]
MTAGYQKNQNFWELASIQSSAQALAGIFLGGVLSQQYGEGFALPSIILGNLILWFIGFASISMGARGRKNIIQITQDYMGHSLAVVAAIIVSTAFIYWFVMNLDATSVVLSKHLLTNLSPTTIGSFLGCSVACLSIGGIRLIRGLCTASFLPLFLILSIAVVQYGHLPKAPAWGVCFGAVAATVIVYLPGIVNFSTFFRHSHSRADSIIGLTLLTIFDMLFETSSIFIHAQDVESFFSNYIFSTQNKLAFYTFIFLSFFCINIVNIYFASPGIQYIFKKIKPKTTYLSIGLTGTILYFFIRTTQIVNFIESTITNWMVNLGIALILGFLTKSVIRHHSLLLERQAITLCWVIACIANFHWPIFSQDGSFISQNWMFMTLNGIWACLISFATILFAKEITECVVYAKKNLSHSGKIKRTKK